MLRHGAAALASRGWRVLTLLGEAPAEPWPEKAGVCGVVPGLGYRSEGLPGDVAALEREVREAVRRHFDGSGPTVWLIHNPSLAKNVVWCGVVAEMAARGEPLLLHLHDFAEDGRLENLAAARAFHQCLGREGAFDDWLHPGGPGVHRALLSQRDVALLRRCGFPAERLHHLPNAVAAHEHAASGPGVAPRDPRLAVAPVRGIRRKNLGELCLLALLGKAEGWRFASTLAPETERARPAFQGWRSLAARMKLPVELGAVSSGLSYPRLMSGAGWAVSTSLNEGFGFAFLEPWGQGLPVMGRDLPVLTDEYRVVGLAFPESYESLEIPVAWLGGDHVRAVWEKALSHAWDRAGKTPPADSLDRLWSTAVREGRVDFGRLDEACQARVLERLPGEMAELDRLRKVALPDQPLSPSFIRRQALAVRGAFGEEAAARRLDALCRHVAAGSAPGGLPEREIRRSLLDEFLTPERFHPLLA